MKNKKKVKREIWALQYMPNEYDANWSTECVFNNYPSFDYFCKIFSKVTGFELTEVVVDALREVYGDEPHDEVYSYIPREYQLVPIDMY